MERSFTILFIFCVAAVMWDRAQLFGKAARNIPHPIEALGFSPSQLKNIESGTILDEITRSGVEIKF